MLIALLWAGFGAQIWAANINTGYQILVVSVAALVMLEFTYQAGFLIFAGIGLGHFLSARLPNYKTRSFSIQLGASVVATVVCFFVGGSSDLFIGCIGFSVICLALQIIGFLCMHFLEQLLLGKSSAYKSSTLLDEHLTK